MEATSDLHAGQQQHPIGLYLKVWVLLFVLSLMSYAVDYFHLQGLLRWGLILAFIFVHLAWEWLALIYAILVPPLALLVLVGLMASEAGHVHLTRLFFFR